MTTDLQDSVGMGCITLGAELLPGTPPESVERVLLAELDRARHQHFDREEIERAKHILIADWVFGHERVHQIALTAGFSLALFDLDHPERQLRAVAACDAEAIRAAAQRYLDPELGGLLGWSLPEA